MILIQIGFDKYNDARNNQVSNDKLCFEHNTVYQCHALSFVFCRCDLQITNETNNVDLRMFYYHSSVLRP